MSQATLLPSSPVAPSFPPLAYQGVPVLTTEMLAQAYEVEAKRIRQNFANNRERFIEGKHFFTITGRELKVFRLQVENFDSQISPKVRALTLWTERGAARNAKMLDSDRAWDVFELLEETFFRVVRKESESRPLADDMVLPPADAPITPADQSILQSIVKAKIEAIPADKRGKGLYPQLWSRFNNHFRLGSYKQLPQCRMADAVTYLMGLELPADRKEELPPPLPQDLPADMDDGRKDALRMIRSIMDSMLAARSVVNLFLYPRPVNMNSPHFERLTHNAQHDFYAAALDCLSAAYQALEAGYRLQHAILPSVERS